MARDDMMDFSSRKIQAIAAGIGLVVIIAGFLLYHALNGPPETVSISATEDDGPAASSPASSSPATSSSASSSPDSAASPALPSHPPARETAEQACRIRGVAVKLAQASFRIPVPPALTLIVGSGVDDDIDFSTKAGIEKGCASPAVATKAIALNFDAMDKMWGVAADWRAGFCGNAADAANHFLCEGEDRAKGTPRRLALATVYDPKDFDADGLFHRPAPQLANFNAWKQEVTKAGDPPPVQQDGAFDVYPGGVWLERNSDKPLLFSCDTDSWPVTGQHYCIGTVDLDAGLRARIEFRTVSGQVGAEASAAEAHLRSLLAAWQ